MKNKRLIWTLVFLAILTLGSIGTDLFKKEHQDANKVVKVGILQFVTHDALDQIEKGIIFIFVDTGNQNMGLLIGKSADTCPFGYTASGLIYNCAIKTSFFCEDH